MSRNHERPFSWSWVGLSLLIFIGMEVLIGIGVGQLVVGRYLSIGTSFMVRGSIQLVAFFLGGFIVGVVSPGIRMAEPAVGAFGAVALTMVVALFTPYTFMRMGLGRLLVAGTIAMLLALWGAWVGERLTGTVKA